MVCALKCLTISFLNWKKKKKKPWFVAFAGFHGVNIPNMANVPHSEGTSQDGDLRGSLQSHPPEQV